MSGHDEDDKHLDGDHWQGQLGDGVAGDSKLHQLELVDLLSSREAKAVGQEEDNQYDHLWTRYYLPEHLVSFHQAQVNLFVASLVLRFLNF